MTGGLEEVQSEMNAGNIDYILSKIKYALHPDMFSHGLEEVQIEKMQVIECKSYQIYPSPRHFLPDIFGWFSKIPRIIVC